MSSTPSILANYETTAYAASGVIKTTKGRAYIIFGYNSLASAQFIQLFDTTSVPADTAIPKVVLTVGASSNFILDLGIYGRAFLSGICWSNSTTGPTKTIGAANCWLNALFV